MKKVAVNKTRKTEIQIQYLYTIFDGIKFRICISIFVTQTPGHSYLQDSLCTCATVDQIRF